MSFAEQRDRMVEEQLKARGLTDERLLAAFRKVPRHSFVPEEFQLQAYTDHPLPIGAGQTISQPYMVALMTSRLQLHGHERVLEIGSGSGYQTAILAELALEVFSVERLPELLRTGTETIFHLRTAAAATSSVSISKRRARSGRSSRTSLRMNRKPHCESGMRCRTTPETMADMRALVHRRILGIASPFAMRLPSTTPACCRSPASISCGISAGSCCPSPSKVTTPS